MLDWIFEGIVTWISSIVSEIMDAVSGLFLDALGTDMTAMEEYFPFVTKAFTIMQYTAWAILFLITGGSCSGCLAGRLRRRRTRGRCWQGAACLPF